jgi:hypothetical protein
LAYLNNLSKSVTFVRPSTVAKWIQDERKEARVDTIHSKAHSIRSASSTKAVEKGNSIQAVKQHANWSLNHDMFEKYYYRLRAQGTTSTKIANSIFSLENNITLESEVEPTMIVLGTTYNQSAGEIEAKNVIHARPWYRRWI